MSRTLTARQHRIASAVCDEGNLGMRQKEIAALVGVDQSVLSDTIRKLSMRMGLVSPTERGHVSRLRLALAAAKAGGFDELAASMGMLDRSTETVQ